MTQTSSSFAYAHIDDIDAIVSPHPEGDRTPIRSHFGIEAFGTNVYTAANVGDPIIGCHDHAEVDDPQHEELYVVLSGRAKFFLGDEKVDAPTGTFVHVPELTVSREAIASEPNTRVLVVGAERGNAFTVSDWDNG